MCEGWSLEIGTAFRGAVVRQERIDQSVMWLASLNASYLGEHLDRAAAMARVEQNMEQAMELGPVSDGDGEVPDWRDEK
jgi:hypothetical protein